MSLLERAQQCLASAHDAPETARNASQPLCKNYLELAKQWTRLANEIAASATESETENPTMSVRYIFILHVNGNVVERLEQHFCHEVEALESAYDLASCFDIDVWAEDRIITQVKQRKESALVSNGLTQ